MHAGGDDQIPECADNRGRSGTGNRGEPNDEIGHKAHDKLDGRAAEAQRDRQHHEHRTHGYDQNAQHIRRDLLKEALNIGLGPGDQDDRKNSLGVVDELHGDAEDAERLSVLNNSEHVGVNHHNGDEQCQHRARFELLSRTVGSKYREVIVRRIAHQGKDPIQVARFGHKTGAFGPKQNDEHLEDTGDTKDRKDRGDSAAHGIEQLIEEVLGCQALLPAKLRAIEFLVNRYRDLESALLTNLVVDLVDRGPDHQLHLPSGVHDADDRRDVLKLLIIREAFILEAEAQARHAMRNRSHVFRPAHSGENLFCHLFVICHHWLLCTILAYCSNRQRSCPEWLRVTILFWR